MKLSVCLVTYNHVAFIEKAIQSVLDQRVDFDYELLIGDDGSNDGTSEICKRYESKYPKHIKHFIRDRSNVIYINGRPTGRRNFIELLQSAKGDYIAMLEGDDFWSDNSKLKRQLMSLEKSPEKSFCFHSVQLLKDGSLTQDYLNEYTPEIVSASLIARGNMIRTCSVMFRNKYQNEIPELLYRVPVGDYAMHLFNASGGDGIFINRNMAVYRMHEGGIWSTYKSMKRNLEWEEMLKEFVTVFDEPMRSNLIAQRLDVLKSLKNHYQSENDPEKVEELDFILHQIKAEINVQNLVLPEKSKNNFSKKSIFDKLKFFFGKKA
jgi:glycosyltransferase involved in cell wall biosynthesis